MESIAGPEGCPAHGCHLRRIEPGRGNGHVERKAHFPLRLICVSRPCPDASGQQDTQPHGHAQHTPWYDASAHRFPLLSVRPCALTALSNKGPYLPGVECVIVYSVVCHSNHLPHTLGFGPKLCTEKQRSQRGQDVTDSGIG